MTDQLIPPDAPCRRFHALLRALPLLPLALGMAVMTTSRSARAVETYGLNWTLWPDGIVYYDFPDDPSQFDTSFPLADGSIHDTNYRSFWPAAQANIEAVMQSFDSYFDGTIEFHRCYTGTVPSGGVPCGNDFIVVVHDAEWPNPGGLAVVGVPGPGVRKALHLPRQPKNRTIQHELGHVLGMQHEQRRTDRYQWLLMPHGYTIPDTPNNAIAGTHWLPPITNYAYSSISHYSAASYSDPSCYSTFLPNDPADPVGYGHVSADGFFCLTDLFGHYAGMPRDEGPDTSVFERFAPEDYSRIQQYYAQELVSPEWNFFQSLASEDVFGTNPYLDGIDDPPRSTPAVSSRGQGDHRIYSRSHGGHLFTLRYENQEWGPDPDVAMWTDLADDVRSAPAADSDGIRDHVVYIDTVGDARIHRSLTDGTYGNGTPLYVGGSPADAAPPGGIASILDGYLAPAVTVRDDVIDVFVVGTEGEVWVTTSLGPFSWTPWRQVILPSAWPVASGLAGVVRTDDIVRLAYVQEYSGGWYGGYALQTAAVQFDAAQVPTVIAEDLVDLVDGPERPGIANANLGLFRVLYIAEPMQLRVWNNSQGPYAGQLIGGLTKQGTGVAAVQTPSDPLDGMLVAMHGDPAKTGYHTRDASGQWLATEIQSGGIWWRSVRTLD